jgi:hypothetical protein
MSRQRRENFSTGKDPGWDVDTRHQRLRAELVLAQSLDPAEFLELLQCEGERLGVVTHPVLIERRAELIIILEPLIATLEGRARTRRKPRGVTPVQRKAAKYLETKCQSATNPAQNREEPPSSAQPDTDYWARG